MPLDAARWQLDLLAADKTAQAFRSVDQRLKQTQAQAQATSVMTTAGFNVMNAALARLSGALTVAAVAHKVWSAGMKAGDLGEQAEQIGLSTDQLQAYRLVAAQAGVSNEQLDTSLMRLAKAMGTAGEGNDEMIAKFDRLGVKLLDSDGRLRKVSDVAPELARGLLGVASETERTALQMEFFGRAGARMSTVLGEIATGNEALVASARRQNALIGPETIKAWDELGDRLKVAEQRFDTLLATVGKPIAVGGLIALNTHLSTMVGLLGAAQKGWDWLSKGGQGVFSTSSEDLIKRQETIKATIENIKDSTDALDVAKVAGYRKELKEISDILASRANVVTLPPLEVTAPRPGVGQPTGKAAAKDGETLANKRLAESQRALDELLQHSRKQFEDAEKIILQYGDGTLYAAQETEKLNEALAFISDATVIVRAQEEIARKADDMARAYRGAAGGVDGFVAGMEQAMADMGRVNTEFELGRQFVDALGDGIDALGGRSKKTFGQIALDFAIMAAQMEMRAAASAVWKSVGGFGGIGDMLGGIFSSGASSSAFNVGGPIIAGTYAEGGRPPVGRPSIVGERGWEMFVPDRPGTIYNQQQLAGMGGGTTIVVHQSNHFGSDVSRAEMMRYLKGVEQSARAGAMQAVLDDRKRGGASKSVFQGG